jgi:hypothetical protein
MRNVTPAQIFLSGRLTGEYWDCRLSLDSKNTIVKVSIAGLDVP